MTASYFLWQIFENLVFALFSFVVLCDEENTLEVGADNELTIEKLPGLPGNLSSSIADTLQKSSSLSGVSVEDFVSFKVVLKGVFMSASYSSSDNGILPLFIYATLKDGGSLELFQLLETSDGQESMESDFGQKYIGSQISSVIIIIRPQETQNTSDIENLVKGALYIKVCGE